MSKLPRVTWFENNRADDGDATFTAYAGSVPVSTIWGDPEISIDAMIDMRKKFHDAKNVLTAETDKKIIPKTPIWPDVLMFDDVEDKPLPPVLGDGYFPGATKSRHKIKERGKYPNGSPDGLVVHYAVSPMFAGEGVLSWGRQKGYTFLSLEGDGTLYQGHHIDQWGYHAGVSRWNKWTGVSDRLVGVEVNCWGKVSKSGGEYYSGRRELSLTDDEVRYFDGAENQIKGYYQKFTEAQEKTLIELCMWLKARNPDVFSFDNVVGHDEIRTMAGKKGDKQDPGGSLSMSMPEFRSKLKRIWDERNK